MTVAATAAGAITVTAFPSLAVAAPAAGPDAATAFFPFAAAVAGPDAATAFFPFAATVAVEEEMPEDDDVRAATSILTASPIAPATLSGSSASGAFPDFPFLKLPSLSVGYFFPVMMVVLLLLGGPPPVTSCTQLMKSDRNLGDGGGGVIAVSIPSSDGGGDLGVLTDGRQTAVGSPLPSCSLCDWAGSTP